MKASRHERDCQICRHERREDIERDFVEWESPARLARQYKLGSRSTVYRHARAFDLFSKRDRNIRAALGRIIEKVGNVRVTGATVVAAVAALSKINAAGQWIDRIENVDLNHLFDKMSRAELERYATAGELPAWFEQTVSGTTDHSEEKG